MTARRIASAIAAGASGLNTLQGVYVHAAQMRNDPRLIRTPVDMLLARYPLESSILGGIVAAIATYLAGTALGEAGNGKE